MANVIKHKRGSGSDPVASDLVVGEVAIRTDVGKLFTKMDNGSVAEIAGGGSDIAINTLSSSSATGGGSATFNGSAYRFTLSAPPSVSAQQLLVSINGVIQKPVAGTGQPSEGFSVDGTDIILGDAPATGSDFFILTFKSLGVSEPADNSVTSAKIVDGAIVNADINASAAIAGSKISPTFTSAGTFVNNVAISGTAPQIIFTDTNQDSDFSIRNDSGQLQFFDTTNNANTFSVLTSGAATIKLLVQDEIVHTGDSDTKIVFDTDIIKLETAGSERLKVNSDGHVDVTGNLDVGAGLDVTGAIIGTVSSANSTILQLIANMGTNNNRSLLFKAPATDSGSEPFVISTSNSLQVDIDNQKTLFINDSGQINLHHDGSTDAKLSTSSSGIDVSGAINATDNITITSSHPKLLLTDDTNPDFSVHVNASAFHIRNETDTRNDFRITSDGTNELYHGGNLKLKTVSGGIDVTGAITGSGDLTIDTNTLHVDSSNNRVGIGTTSPGYPLDVQTASGDASMRLRTAGTGTGDDTIFRLQVAGTTQDNFIYFGDADDSNAGQINYNHNSNFLRFFTNAGERLRIDSSGVVSIGTDSPNGSASKLQVEDSGENNVYFVGNTSTLGARLILQNKNSTANAFSKVEGADASGQGICSIKFNSVSDANNEGFLSFETRPASGLPTERMVIDSSGNVSIGASSYGGGGSSPKFYISTTSDRAVKIHNTNSATSSVQITNAATGQGDDNGMQLAALGNGECLIANAEAERIIIMSQEANNNTPVVNFNKPQGPSNAQTTMIAFETGNQGRGAVLSSSSDGGSPSFSSVSDYRIKTNIRDYTNGYDNIKAIPVKLFDMISDGTKDIKGWIAHEVQAFIPEAVMGVKDAVDSDENPILQQLSYGLFMPDVVGALQTAIAKIETLEAKVEALEAK